MPEQPQVHAGTETTSSPNSVCPGRARQPTRVDPRDHTAAHAGVRRRFSPHELRHAHAVEFAREGVPLIVIERQLGHSNLGITSVYLQGIDNAEIIEAVHSRRQPMQLVARTLFGEVRQLVVAQSVTADSR
jgi:integrase